MIHKNYVSRDLGSSCFYTDDYEQTVITTGVTCLSMLTLAFSTKHHSVQELHSGLLLCL